MMHFVFKINEKPLSKTMKSCRINPNQFYISMWIKELMWMLF